MREQVLTIIFQLHDIYRDELAALPEIISKIHPLLKDPVESVRQLATQVCGCLYQTMGESLVVSQSIFFTFIYISWNSEILIIKMMPYSNPFGKVQ